MDCSLPGSSVYGIFQARVLEWGAIASSAKFLPCFLRFTVGTLMSIVDVKTNFNSRANCISHPVDLRLLSPAVNAYSAARSVPVSRLISLHGWLLGLGDPKTDSDRLVSGAWFWY